MSKDDRNTPKPSIQAESRENYIDRTLLEANLKLTPQQRLEQAQRMASDLSLLQAAAAKQMTNNG